MHTLRNEISRVEVRVLDSTREGFGNVCSRAHGLCDALEARDELCGEDDERRACEEGDDRDLLAVDFEFCNVVGHDFGGVLLL